MSFWRMQLHPHEGARAIGHAIDSLSRGYIGLGFRNDFSGDLSKADPRDLPRGQRVYQHFATTMQEGDFVLIIAHHHPVALVEVIGPYNYVKDPDPHDVIGVWFRHFRRVKVHGYYGDWYTNPAEWEKTISTVAIGRAGRQSQTYRIIQQWREWLGPPEALG